MTPEHIRVLIVDDDEATRLLISRHLQREGYDTAMAASGDEALDRLQQESFDVALLDMIMPGLSGYQLLAQIKADRQWAALLVIMISAIDDLDNVIRCLELGAEDYLLKPVNARLIKTRLHACVERQWLRKQEEEYLQQLRAEKELAEAANRAKNTFLANMSHELRTPLNAILGYSDILQEDFEAEGYSQFMPDLENIRASGKHLLQIIDDILDISKLESGRMELYLESFEVRSLVDSVLQEVRSRIAANHNVIEIDCPPAIGTMRADFRKIRQILLNLLSNAAKFTQNGTISLLITQESTDDSPAVTFTVCDTGIGISSDEQQRIFQAFTQVDDSSTRRYGGTGLGLSISQRFSEMMGGSIIVSSAVQQGSTFTLRLPRDMQAIATQLEAPDLLPPLEVPTLPDSSSLVLVINDDRTVRDSLVQCLNQDGYRVVTSWSGQEGVRLARDLRPSLILLDMLLPQESTWITLSGLKSDLGLRDIPVLLMVSDPSPQADLPAIALVLGAYQYLTQPEHFRHLTQTTQPYKALYEAPHKAADSLNQSARLLLIQEDSATQQILQRLLTADGWSVNTVSSIDAAIAQMLHEEHDLILLSLTIIDSRNFQSLIQLADAAIWRSTPLIVLLSRDIPVSLDRSAFAGSEELQAIFAAERVTQPDRTATWRSIRQAMTLYLPSVLSSRQVPTSS